MITHHGERELVIHSIALDVDAFFLKPNDDEKIEKKLRCLLTDPPTKILPVESYICLDVEAPISELIQRPTLTFDHIVDEFPEESLRQSRYHVIDADEEQCALDRVPHGSRLLRELRTEDGFPILLSGTLLTHAVIQKLKDLKALGFEIGELTISKSCHSENGTDAEIPSPARSIHEPKQVSDRSLERRMEEPKTDGTRSLHRMARSEKTPHSDHRRQKKK